MPRSLKKLIYGLVYIFFLGLLSVIIFGLPTAPNKCSNTQEGCNGVDIKPLEIKREIKILRFYQNQALVLAKAFNPNDKTIYLSYRFLIYDNNDILTEEAISRDYILPSTVKYIYQQLKTPFNKIEKTDIEFSDYRLGGKDLLPDIDLTRFNTPTGGEIKVEGILKNKSTISFDRIKIIAVLFDEFGDELFISHTIAAIKAFEEKQFLINFPEDFYLKETIDPQRTKIYVFDLSLAEF